MNDFSKLLNIYLLKEKEYHFPRGAVTKYHELGWCETREIYLTVLKARNLKSRCQHGYVLSQGSR